jgi:hypothetical protein
VIGSKPTRISGLYFGDLSIEGGLLFGRSLGVGLNDVRLIDLFE